LLWAQEKSLFKRLTRLGGQGFSTMSVLCEQAPRLLPSFTAAECHFTASVLARTTLCSSAEQAAQQQAAAEARPERAAPAAARADPAALQWPELVRGALWGAGGAEGACGGRPAGA